MGAKKEGSGYGSGYGSGKSSGYGSGKSSGYGSGYGSGKGKTTPAAKKEGDHKAKTTAEKVEEKVEVVVCTGKGKKKKCTTIVKGLVGRNFICEDNTQKIHSPEQERKEKASKGCQCCQEKGRRRKEKRAEGCRCQEEERGRRQKEGCLCRQE